MTRALEKRGIENTNQIWVKLLFTYLAVVVVCLGVVIFLIHQISSSAYNAHVQSMSGGGMGSMMTGSMMSDLSDAFDQAINSAALWGGVIAVGVAIGLSLVISRRITRPVHDMAVATERIAAGDYGQRVSILSRDEIGSLAHSLNSMAMKLDESQKLRRELMANIAHELRTPLTSISGYMEGLEDGVVPAGPETYELVRSEAERLSRLVEDLQRLTVAESGAEVLDIIPVKTGAFLERVLRKIKPQFESKQVELSLTVDGDTPAVMADEDKLDQILVNLVTNALRYTDPGGRVGLSARGDEGAVEISVTDNGDGIGAKDLPHIFDRFYRADKSRARVSGGTGIGLTIVKRYTEMLKGRIAV